MILGGQATYDITGSHVKKILSLHVNVWQKQLQYCKVISLQLIKIIEKQQQQKISTYQLFSRFLPRSPFNFTCFRPTYLPSSQFSYYLTSL